MFIGLQHVNYRVMGIYIYLDTYKLIRNLIRNTHFKKDECTYQTA